jgi:hypothetical protein
MMYPFTVDDKTRLAMAYNGLTLNNPADDPDDTYEVNVLAVDDQWDALMEPKVQTHGMEGYRPRKVSTVIRVEGIVRAPSMGKLFDKVLALNAAFDMVNAYIADSSATRQRGFLAFTGSMPTADETNYTNKLIPVQYFVRSIKKPVSRTSQYEGTNARFSLLLQAADPRLYHQSLSSASRANAGALTLTNTLATFPSWPTVTITLTGAGTQIVSLSLAGPTTKDLRVDLSGIASGHVIVIDMEHQQITDDGTVNMALLGTVKQWWDMNDYANVLTVANISGTLAGTVAVSWRRAFA